MRKKITAFALSLLSALLLLTPALQTASASQPKEDYIAANHTKNNGKPYYLMVNRAQSTVTVYGLDDSGYYTVPVKAMICSTGRKGHATPTGTFSIGGRWSWVHMVDDSYGQYCTQIKGNILFHSVCYTKKDPSTLMTEEYNGLGAPASLGCVRLQTIDAKWIYENCAQGTKVTVYDGASPGPLGKPERLVSYISDDQANGWDPTDPRKNNPWHAILAANGEGAAPSIPVPEQVPYAQVCQALYKLSGETGLTHSSEFVTWATRHRLLDDMAESDFYPSAAITRQDLITMIYRYETLYLRHAVRGSASLTRFADGTAVQSYAVPAMRWAVGNKLIQGTTENTLHPTSYASHMQLTTILERYGKL